MNVRRGKHYKKQLFIVDFYTHYNRPGYIIIPKAHLLSRGRIMSRCCRFDLLHFPVLSQSDAARSPLSPLMHAVAGDQSTVSAENNGPALHCIQFLR